MLFSHYFLILPKLSSLFLTKLLNNYHESFWSMWDYLVDICTQQGQKSDFWFQVKASQRVLKMQACFGDMKNTHNCISCLSLWYTNGLLKSSTSEKWRACMIIFKVVEDRILIVRLRKMWRSVFFAFLLGVWVNLDTNYQ